MTRRRLAVLTALVGIFWSVAPGTAWAGCPEILGFLSGQAVDVVCFESPDLTTTNVLAAPLGPTTPPDNSLPGLPLFAFTPRTDRGVISPNPPDRTPIIKSVPGLQVQGRFADDPTGEARFVLRLPHEWNGRLVVAGASGTRSEFNGDFAWSDYVVQKGLRLRVAEQAGPEPPTHDVGRSAGLPAEPCVPHLRALLRERPGQVVH